MVNRDNNFNRLRQAVIKTYDEGELKEGQEFEVDATYVKQTVATIFVTGPLDNGEPFQPEYTDGAERKVDEIDGQEFSIHSVKISPHTDRYDLHFYATSPAVPYVYEFEGSIYSYTGNGAEIDARKAIVYKNTGSDGTSVSFHPKNQ